MNRYADFRILIVDDNRNNLFTLHTLISRYMDVAVLEADRLHTMQEAWMEERMEKLVDEVTAELVEEDARAAEEARRAAAVAAGETPVPIDPDEGDEKGGGKTLYYVAGGVAALLILGAVLGGKEESSDTLTVLSPPPARPDPGP